MIAAAATQAVVIAELDGVRAWIDRNDYELTWEPDSLILRATLTHRLSSEKFYLVGLLEKYPVLPPAWTFTASDGAGGGQCRFFPNPEGPPPCGAWVFIKHGDRGLICAPFNRLAYEKNSAHPEWGDAVQWRSVAPSYVQAHTLGEMFSVIDRDLHYTRGRMQ